MAAHKGPFVEQPSACGCARTHAGGTQDCSPGALAQGKGGEQARPPVLWLGAGPAGLA